MDADNALSIVERIIEQLDKEISDLGLRAAIALEQYVIAQYLVIHWEYYTSLQYRALVAASKRHLIRSAYRTYEHDNNIANLQSVVDRCSSPHFAWSEQERLRLLRALPPAPPEPITPDRLIVRQLNEIGHPNRQVLDLRMTDHSQKFDEMFYPVMAKDICPDGYAGPVKNVGMHTYDVVVPSDTADAVEQRRMTWNEYQNGPVQI